MRNAKNILLIAVFANLALTLWHLYLAVEMHQGTTGTLAERIAIQTCALTLVGVALLAARYRRIGSLVLIVVLALGFVMGSLEHFFVAGPYNVFDVNDDAGVAGWIIPFDVSCALLLVTEVAGLWAAARMLVARA
jgi:hypothetical protein